MKYQIKTSSRFKRDLKRCAKRGLDMQLVYDAMNLLAKDGLLPAEYKPHQLKGDHKGQWECHIQPNWLMTLEQHDNELMLLFLQTGTHVDLFGW